VYVEMDVLLNLEQYQQAVPDTLACFLPYGTYILFESISLSITSIVDLCDKPLSLLRWDPTNKTLYKWIVRSVQCITYCMHACWLESDMIL
jgi:hypothetical protein